MKPRGKHRLLSAEKIERIKTLKAQGGTHRSIAEAVNTSPSTVANVIHNKTTAAPKLIKGYF